MKHFVAPVAIAVALGIVVMLAPVIVFPYYYPAAESTESNNLRGAYESNATSAASQDETTSASKAFPLASLDKAARTYGTLDAEASTSYSSNLPKATLVMITGLAAALIISLYYRNRM